jgi:hypothetical protein
VTSSPWPRLLASIISRPRTTLAAAGAVFLAYWLIHAYVGWQVDQALADRPVVYRFGPAPTPPPAPDANKAPVKPDLPSKPARRPKPGLWTFPLASGRPAPSGGVISDLRPMPAGVNLSIDCLPDGSGTVTVTPRPVPFFDWKARRRFYLEGLLPPDRPELWRAELGVEYRLAHVGRLGLDAKLAVGDWPTGSDARRVAKGRSTPSREFPVGLVGLRLTWE